MEDAEKSLSWLRGWRKTNDVQQEFGDLVSAIRPDYQLQQLDQKHRQTDEQKENQCCKFNVSNYKQPTFYKPFFLIAFAFMAGQFSGMTTLTTYAVNIFATFGSPVDKYVATMLLGIAQILGTSVCAIIIHSIGKRKLAFVSTFGTGLLCGGLGLYAYFYLGVTNLDQGLYFNSTFGDSIPVLSWIPIVCLLGAAFFAYLGIRHVPWILIGEVYPPDIRGFASGLSGGFGYILGFLSNKTFFLTVDAITLPGIYMTYGCVGIFSAFILLKFLPETEGYTLAEVQEHFEGRRNLIKAGIRKKSVVKVGISNDGLVGDNGSRF